MSDSFRVLDAPAAGWDTLARDDPNATPSHRPELWSALADALPGGSVRFVAVESEGALIGGAGIVLERRAGFEWIHALPWLLGGAPLSVPGRQARVDATFAGALVTLMRERRSVGGEWALYRAAGAEPDAGVLERVPGETTRIETALVRLDQGLDAARARLGARLRQYLRNPSREFAFADEPEALEEVYVLHTRQARAWRGFVPLPLELSRRLLSTGRMPRDGAAEAMPPLAHLFTLRGEDGLMAATLFLDHPRELFAWWSGIDPRARGHHVFPLLLWKAIEWAAVQGRARVNLGGSAGQASLIAFKQALGAEERRFPVRWLSAEHARTPGRWLAALQAWRRRRRPRGRADSTAGMRSNAPSAP